MLAIQVNGVINVPNSGFGKGSTFAIREETSTKSTVMEGALGKPHSNIPHSTCDSLEAAADLVISRVQIEAFPPPFDCCFPANLAETVKMWT